MNPQPTSCTLVIGGVCCSTEESVLRKRLDRHIGPDTYFFNPVTNELHVTTGIAPESVMTEVRAAGFTAEEKAAAPAPESFMKRHAAGLRTASSAFVSLLGAVFHLNGASMPGIPLIVLGIIIGGIPVFRKAFLALRQGSLDMNTLMTAATIGAIAIRKWEEAAAVIVLFSVSLMLESYSASRTRRAIGSLMALSPEEAIVLRDGKELSLPASSLSVGARVLVKAGIRVPVDGIVLEGSASVSEAMLTGEAMPVPKAPGDAVYAGCVSNDGSLVVRAETTFNDTRLSRILHLVEEAQRQRAPVQTFVDRFASVYTRVVMAGAVLLAVIPPLVTGGSFHEWIYRSLVALVIACPCALVIATPVALVSSLTTAARAGMLIKGGKTIETLAGTRAVVFDKTGTLTVGKPVISDVISLNGMAPSEFLPIVSAIESHSAHPLAGAIARRMKDEAETAPLPVVSKFSAIHGQGVRAEVDGTEYFVGNQQFTGLFGISDPMLSEAVRSLENKGRTVVVFGTHGQAIAVLGAVDQERDESRTLVAAMNREGVEHTAIYSGDRPASVNRVAETARVDSVSPGLMPEEKLEGIRRLKDRYGTVVMVGDGVNDTPALAGASVGIAMGSRGADAAMEAADVVLMADDLMTIPKLLRLSRSTISIIKQNIAIALTIKGVFLLLASTGAATLWMALVADDGATLLVIANAMRLLKPLK
jgi:Cd2+/Zn2+-exporting ATPase